MTHPDPDEQAFQQATSRLLRREALRRAAAELNTTSGAGLESTLGQISAEVTAEALARVTEQAPPKGPR